MASLNFCVRCSAFWTPHTKWLDVRERLDCSNGHSLRTPVVLRWLFSSPMSSLGRLFRTFAGHQNQMLALFKWETTHLNHLNHRKLCESSQLLQNLACLVVRGTQSFVTRDNVKGEQESTRLKTKRRNGKEWSVQISSTSIPNFCRVRFMSAVPFEVQHSWF